MAIKDDKKKKAWQGVGELQVGNTTQDVTFQADFHERPGYYTVQFNLILPPNVDPGQLVLPRAELIWSVEGGSFVRRVVNLGLGNAISGAGQAVRVRMFDYSILSVAPPAITYTVSGQVTRGTRPTSARPPILTTRTIGADPDARGQQSSFGILAGTNATVDVPQNAGINAVLINARTFNVADPPIVQNELSITHISGGFNLDGYNYDQTGRWMPIAPATKQIFIENGSPSDILITPTWAIEG